MFADSRPVAPAEESRLTERLIARDRWIVGAALIGAIGLAWAWLVRPVDMTAMMAAPLSAAYLAWALPMWALMMVAMMLPSASPMILLYARVARMRFGPAAGQGIAAFLFAYVLVWTAFSAVAALLQAVLVGWGLADAMRLEVGDRRLGGALLVAAGLYQLTPWKSSCLDQCRSPLTFIANGIRPGAAAALRLGIRHGLYCLGCCWALMLLLFAGGVMNLAWVAGLAVLVAAEKMLPWRRFSMIAGAALIFAGATLALS